MKKQEFIDAVAEKLDITKKDAREISDNIFEVFEDVLVQGKRIPLGKIGRLEVRERAARNGVNPQTGEPLEIPARNAIAYQASEYGKRLVN